MRCLSTSPARRAARMELTRSRVIPGNEAITSGAASEMSTFPVPLYTVTKGSARRTRSIGKP